MSAISLAVLGGAAGSFISFWLAPQQQVRQQQGLDDAQAGADEDSPSLVVQDARFGVTDPSAASPRVFSLPEMQRETSIGSPGRSNKLMPDDPGDVLVGKTVAAGDDGSGAQPETLSQVTATLVGNHNRTVRVSSISARIVERVEPPSGTLLRSSSEGETTDPMMGFDLDSADLSARVLDPSGADPTPTAAHYLDSKQLTAAKNEPVTLNLMVYARNGLYRFVIDIRTDDGRTVTVDDHGRPWTASSFAARYDRAYAVDLGSMSGPTVVPCDWPAGCRRY